MLSTAVQQNVITLNLKQRKRVISLRVDEYAVSVIDRYLASNALPTRTTVLSKLIEAFAAGLEGSTGRLEEVKISLVFNFGSTSLKREVVIKIPG